jgi:hypothetical protein
VSLLFCVVARSFLRTRKQTRKKEKKTSVDEEDESERGYDGDGDVYHHRGRHCVP